MVMLSLVLLNKLPFKQVLLHAMVRDAHGKVQKKTDRSLHQQGKRRGFCIYQLPAFTPIVLFICYPLCYIVFAH